MSEAAIIQRLETRLDRMERLLKALVKESTRKTWVKAADVFRITGWDKEKLRRMRAHGVIKWKKDNGFFYELESIPKIFIRHEDTITSAGVLAVDVSGGNTNQKIA